MLVYFTISILYSPFLVYNLHSHVHKANDAFIIITHLFRLSYLSDFLQMPRIGIMWSSMALLVTFDTIPWWIHCGMMVSVLHHLLLFHRKRYTSVSLQNSLYFKSLIHVTRNDACQVVSDPSLSALIIASNQDNVFGKATTLTPELFPLPLPQVHVKIRVSIGKARNANMSTIWLRATCTVVWYYTWSSPPPHLLFPLSLI